MKSKQILVTGVIAYDQLFQYGQTFLEDLSEAITLEVLSISFEPYQYVQRNGGTGANISWNISLLGGRPLLVANVGRDGDHYVKLLQERGIDTRYVETKETAMTSTGICCTDKRGHQIWFFYRGADALGHWPEIQDTSAISYAIIGARYHSHMLEALEWCKEKGIPSIFDPGQEILRFTEDELNKAVSLATGIIMNEFEWGMFGKRLKKGAEEIATETKYLIVTRGENGYTIYTKDGSNSYPRCNCDKPINPTGAGDAFRAGLVQGLVAGWSLEQSSKLGAAIASFVVEQEGTLLSALDRALIQKRVKEAYGESLPELPL